jgi:hypothetical protein
MKIEAGIADQRKRTRTESDRRDKRRAEKLRQVQQHFRKVVRAPNRSGRRA